MKDCTCGMWMDAKCPQHGALIMGFYTPGDEFMANNKICTCGELMDPRCPMHGYIKPVPGEPTQVNVEELFLKKVAHRARLTKGLDAEISDLLYAIIDRAEIGRSIAILEDEVDNFNFVIQLAQEALKKL